ncbi:DEAD/DEAH box helicase [Thermaerobacter composti]|uniref:DEAD/DEAH box helicase n=1 Tax=Thermaerobacter composti TaxID=554949 RepID=A0ABZ0QL73_9FIRM|nr:DEAD/DEAH box helicase [Thermaerobacter composti]PZN03173.1 MAG: ATP-dependent helicase [Bacillota bacterium]WPD17974.1 DEAD/DEAH box helicase [Thermaerobacter composti]
MPLELRPYQREAIDAFWAAHREEGVRRGIINLPTGTGKTITALTAARERGGRTLWLAHRDELIEQPRRAIAAVWPEAETGVVKAEQDEPDAQVVFASVQTACRPQRLARLRGFDFVVVDEAHHATAPSYVRVLRGVRCFADDGPPTLGLTATVERGDQKALGAVFERIVYQLQLLEAIQRGYLVDLRPLRIMLNVNLDAVHTVSGDFHQGELDAALLKAGVAEAVADAYVRHGEGRKAIVFTVSVDQARRTAEALQRRGVAAEWISGDLPIDERRAILHRLHTGETRVVCNCAVLTEGFDEPSVSCVVVARPTKSKTLYLQMIGRGTRLHPGKEDCLVIDVAGATERHTLIQAPALFGLPADAELEGRTITEALQDNALMDAMEARTGSTELATLRSLLRPDWQQFHKRVRWLKVDDGLYCLPAGEAGNLALIEVGPEQWVVELVPRDRRLPVERLTPQPVWQELAQGLAEDYVRRAEAVGLVLATASWRLRPASEKQLAALRRWGIEPRPGMTAGEASDELTMAAIRARYRRRAS